MSVINTTAIARSGLAYPRNKITCKANSLMETCAGYVGGATIMRSISIHGIDNTLMQ